MLTLLYFLAGWVEAWSASGRTTPSMVFTMGSDDRPKRAAWAAIEGANSMGQITVWESGECDIELYDTETGKELIHESVRLGSAEDLGSALRRTLNACT
jgi:hypothetical protein